MKLSKRLMAEFVGTFALVFAGTGAVISNAATNGVVGHVGVAMTFGLVIAVMVYAYKDVSGAQFNPAVSIALWLRGVFPAREVVPYVATQLAAATVASGILRLVIPASLGITDLGATVPTWPVGAALAIEVVATFFLVTVILGVVRGGDRANPWAGIAIGGTVALCALFAGPLTGASMNPARSFGPAILSPGAFGSYWLYAVGPVAGGVVASLVDRLGGFSE